MTVLLLIVTAGAMLLGYMIMRRLDAFLGGGGIPDSPRGRQNAGFLVYGSRQRRHGFVKAVTVAQKRLPPGFLRAFAIQHFSPCRHGMKTI